MEESTVAPSRWDALKPKQPRGNRRGGQQKDHLPIVSPNVPTPSRSKSRWNGPAPVKHNPKGAVPKPAGHARAPRNESLFANDVGATTWMRNAPSTPPRPPMDAVTDFPTNVRSSRIVSPPLRPVAAPRQNVSYGSPTGWTVPPLRAPPGLAGGLLPPPQHQAFAPPSPYRRPQENPFAPVDDDSRIEQELQELGGQMVGSLLDC